jgi:uncharacterized membrane protein YidH (DUF202 family)
VRFEGLGTGRARGEPARRRLPRVAIAIVSAGVVLVLLGPFLPGDGDCQGAPCDTSAVVGPWVVLALGLIWIVALVWLIVALVRRRR